MTDDQLEKLFGPGDVAEMRCRLNRRLRISGRPHRRAGRIVARWWRRFVVWCRRELAGASGHGPDTPEDMW